MTLFPLQIISLSVIMLVIPFDALCQKGSKEFDVVFNFMSHVNRFMGKTETEVNSFHEQYKEFYEYDCKCNIEETSYIMKHCHCPMDVPYENTIGIYSYSLENDKWVLYSVTHEIIGVQDFTSFVIFFSENFGYIKGYSTGYKAFTNGYNWCGKYSERDYCIEIKTNGKDNNGTSKFKITAQSGRRTMYKD